jgi:anti-anti-sigma factor
MTSLLPPLPYSVNEVVPSGTARCHAVRLGATAQVTIAGELCLESSSTLLDAASRAGVDTAQTLVVDLTAVTFADSSAIATLLRLARRAEAEDVHLVVLAAPGPVLRLMDLTGVRESLRLLVAAR